MRYNFTIYQFIITEFSRAITLFTLVSLLLSITRLINFVSTGTADDNYVVSLFVYDIVSVFLFRQGAYLHDFWLYQLAPAISMSAGRAIFIAFEKLKKLSISPQKPSCYLQCAGYFILSTTLTIFIMGIIIRVYKGIVNPT